MVCRRCSLDDELFEVPRPDTPHNAEIRCRRCDAFVSWKPKDKNIGKRPKNKITPEDMGIDYCQLCLRKKNRLGTNETLDTHHVIEISICGKDEKENIWVVCTHCHALVHHTRRYLLEHFSDLWEQYEEFKSMVREQQLAPEVYEEVIQDKVDTLEKAPWE